MKSAMKKNIKILTGVLLFGLLLLFLAVQYAIKNVLPYSPIRPYRCTQNDIYRYFNGISHPLAAGLDYKDFNITVEDTILLRGWFIYSKSVPAEGTIFLLHGIGSCRAAMLPMAKLLASHGFNCILYDSRAQGESGGINCSFGFFEKKDLSAYIDSAEVRFPGSQPYAVYGHSLGAAVAIQSMADEKRLVCGIAESPFARLRDIIRDYFARMIYMHINAIPDEAMKNTENIAHFRIDSVQPAAAALRITQPVMIVHGIQDQNISVSYGRQVFDNLNSPKKEWYPIPGGDHNNLRRIGGVEYEQRIVGFFKKYLLPSVKSADK
ncbi:MAG: alpha/beta fold hydrolase [Bacteroidota bacterium]